MNAERKEEIAELREGQKLPHKGMNITSHQYRYLKHAGALNNVKVSFCLRDGLVCIHIQDHEFETFEAALRFLQEDGRMIDRAGFEVILP